MGFADLRIATMPPWLAVAERLSSGSILRPNSYDDLRIRYQYPAHGLCMASDGFDGRMLGLRDFSTG